MLLSCDFREKNAPIHKNIALISGTKSEEQSSFLLLMYERPSNQRPFCMFSEEINLGSKLQHCDAGMN